MFKFIKKYAEGIDHVAVYPMISLLIFFLFFIMLLVYVRKMDKKSILELSNIPLDHTETNTQQL